MRRWGSGRSSRIGAPAILIDLGDQVRRVVCRHRSEHLGGIGVGAGLDELDLVLGVELLEDVGLEFPVLSDGLDDLFTLLVRGRLDEVGDLGRVQPGQLAVGDAQAGRRHVGDERLDAPPVDDGPGTGTLPEAARQQATEHTPRRGVDPHDLPAAVVSGQLDLVGPDQPAAHEIDEMAGLEVLGQEQFARPALEAA